VSRVLLSRLCVQDNFAGAALIVPHDDIHLAVMYGHQPVYETMKRDLT
jgi:hypothetical protein